MHATGPNSSWEGVLGRVLLASSEVHMPEKSARDIPAAAQGEVMAVVTTASQAQAAKVREILQRLDQVTALDPRQVENLSSLLQASKADGGCGIGCW